MDPPNRPPAVGTTNGHPHHATNDASSSINTLSTSASTAGSANSNVAFLSNGRQALQQPLRQQESPRPQHQPLSVSSEHHPQHQQQRQEAIFQQTVLFERHISSQSGSTLQQRQELHPQQHPSAHPQPNQSRPALSFFSHPSHAPSSTSASTNLPPPQHSQQQRPQQEPQEAQSRPMANHAPLQHYQSRTDRHHPYPRRLREAAHIQTSSVSPSFRQTLDRDQGHLLAESPENVGRGLDGRDSAARETDDSFGSNLSAFAVPLSRQQGRQQQQHQQHSTSGLPHHFNSRSTGLPSAASSAFHAEVRPYDQQQSSQGQQEYQHTQSQRLPQYLPPIQPPQSSFRLSTSNSMPPPPPRPPPPRPPSSRNTTTGLGAAGPEEQKPIRAELDIDKPKGQPTFTNPIQTVIQVPERWLCIFTESLGRNNKLRTSVWLKYLPGPNNIYKKNICRIASLQVVAFQTGHVEMTMGIKGEKLTQEGINVSLPPDIITANNGRCYGFSILVSSFNVDGLACGEPEKALDLNHSRQTTYCRQNLNLFMGDLVSPDVVINIRAPTPATTRIGAEIERQLNPEIPSGWANGSTSTAATPPPSATDNGGGVNSRVSPGDANETIEAVGRRAVARVRPSGPIRSILRGHSHVLMQNPWIKAILEHDNPDVPRPGLQAIFMAPMRNSSSGTESLAQTRAAAPSTSSAPTSASSSQATSASQSASSLPAANTVPLPTASATTSTPPRPIQYILDIDEVSVGVFQEVKRFLYQKHVRAPASDLLTRRSVPDPVVLNNESLQEPSARHEQPPSGDPNSGHQTQTASHLPTASHGGAHSSRSTTTAATSTASPSRTAAQLSSMPPSSMRLGSEDGRGGEERGAQGGAVIDHGNVSFDWQSLYLAASHFHDQELRLLCKSTLLSLLTEETVIPMLFQWGFAFPELNQGLMDYIRDHYKMLFGRSDSRAFTQLHKFCTERNSMVDRHLRTEILIAMATARERLPEGL